MKVHLFVFNLTLVLFFLPTLGINSQTIVENDPQKFLEKAKNLEKLFPDSSAYYYQKALGVMEKNDSSYSNDKSIITTCLNIGWIFHQQNKFSIARDYYTKALNKAIAIEHDSLMGESFFSIAEINLENGNYSNAVKSYNSAREKFVSIGYFEGIFWTDIGLGIIYRELGNTEFSKRFYLSAENLAENNDRNDYVAISYNNLGNLYKQVGDYTTSLEYLHKALKSFENYGEEKFISDCLDGIGEVYFEIGNYQRALEYFSKSTKIAESLGDSYRLFSFYSKLAKTYAELENDENALMYFSKTIELANSVGDKGRLSEILITVSDYYKRNNNQREAQDYLVQSLEISRSVGDSVSIANALNALSQLYFQNQNFAESYVTALESYQISSKNNIMKTLAESSKSLSSILEIRGDFKSSLYYHKIHNRTLDILLNSEKIKILEDKEAKYNLERIEREKLELENKTLANEKELQAQNNLILYLIIIIAIIIIIALVFYYRKRIEAKEIFEKSTLMKDKINTLNKELDDRNRELTSKALLISQNNDVLKNVVGAIEEYINDGNGDTKVLKKQKSHLQEIYEEKSWSEFIQHFEQVHPKFYKNLQQNCNDLTSGEQKVCAFLKMKLNTKDISQITGQSTKAIEVMRSRIRKKLNIPHEQSLTKTIQSF